MIYKFKSKAAGDVIMLGANGDHALRIIGKPPSATGIIEVADMPAAMAALEQAIAIEEAARSEAPSAEPKSQPAADRISLRQRAWPLVEMMKRSHKENADIVWGV